MQLSKIGEFAAECWMNIPAHFPYFYLDASVVRPNHLHGIVLIEKPYIDNGRDPDIVVETTHALSLQSDSLEPQHLQLETKSNISVFRTREKTPFQQWSVLLNLLSQNVATKINCRLAGNHDFTIT